MEKSANEQKKNNIINLENRSTLSISGIIEVISSCETELVLVSSYGELSIEGKDLKILKFNAEEGLLGAEGTIDSIKYKGAKTPLLKRIFK